MPEGCLLNDFVVAGAGGFVVVDGARVLAEVQGDYACVPLEAGLHALMCA